jgi:hypothetical protein
MVSKLKQEQMFELVQLWQQSGESAKSFVAHQGIALSKFLYWRKKFRDQQQPGSGSFIQLHTGMSADLRLRYPNGVELMLPVNTPAGMIRELISLY